MNEKARGIKADELSNEGINLYFKEKLDNNLNKVEQRVQNYRLRRRGGGLGNCHDKT